MKLKKTIQLIREEETVATLTEYDYEEDDEGIDGYRRGGYHPVHIGDIYKGQYLVVKKLGWGHFSTVWLCLTLKEHEQMKINELDDYYKNAKDEVCVNANVDDEGNMDNANSSNNDVKKPPQETEIEIIKEEEVSTSSSTNTINTIGNSYRWVALKIQRSAEHYRAAAYDEIKLLKAVKKESRFSKLQTSFQTLIQETNEKVETDLLEDESALAQGAEGNSVNNNIIWDGEGNDEKFLKTSTVEKNEKENSQEYCGCNDLPFAEHVVHLLDQFDIEGPHGNHVGMVFQCFRG